MDKSFISIDDSAHCRLPTTARATLYPTICSSAAGTIRRVGLTVMSASARNLRKVMTAQPPPNGDPACRRPSLIGLFLSDTNDRYTCRHSDPQKRRVRDLTPSDLLQKCPDFRSSQLCPKRFGLRRSRLRADAKYETRQVAPKAVGRVTALTHPVFRASRATRGVILAPITNEGRPIALHRRRCRPKDCQASSSRSGHADCRHSSRCSPRPWARAID